MRDKSEEPNGAYKEECFKKRKIGSKRKIGTHGDILWRKNSQAVAQISGVLEVLFEI